ncbi:MAG: hypothetical protein AB7E13_10265 [Arcobacteraceae bacterium]
MTQKNYITKITLLHLIVEWRSGKFLATIQLPKELKLLKVFILGVKKEVAPNTGNSKTT